LNISEQMKNLTEGVITSYEDRVSNIENIFFNTHQLLGDYQKALFGLRDERDTLTKELRDKLAKTESLRHKDFDQMMGSILNEQSEREKEVKTLLEEYVAEQKGLAKGLKESLSDFNQQLVKGDKIRLGDYKQKIAEIKKQQLERQNQVKGMLKGFQTKASECRRENEELAQEIKNLLGKGESVRIKDFKAMLRGFQKERKGAADAWQSLSLAMAKKREKTKEVMMVGKSVSSS